MKTQQGTSKRLYRLAGRNRKLYVLAFSCTAITAALNLSVPVIIGLTVDNIIIGQSMGIGFLERGVELFGGADFIAANLWIPFAVIVALTAIRSIFGYTLGRLNALAAENVSKELRDKIYDHIQKLPYSYHVQAKTGDLIQRSTSDVENIRLFLASQISELARTAAIIIFSTIVMMNLYLPLAVISMVTLPIIAISSYIFHYRIKQAFLIQDEKEGELFDTIQENLAGVRVVRAFGRSGYEMEKFEKRNSEFRDLARKLFKVRALFWSSSDFVCFFQLFLILIFGVTFVINGHITLGTLLVFWSYGNTFIWPIRAMGRVLADMGRCGVSLDRIEEILDTPQEDFNFQGLAPDLKGDIVFENVTFTYEDGVPLLKDLSFTIKKGETVAILGSTGSGKSTLISLLLLLYDYRGSIKISGVELRNIQKLYLREKVGLVLQEPFLYSKTIEKNLKMARERVEESEMIKAAKTARVHHVITDFERGYDTIVGERGVTLSGGQRQRVAIARTIIKNSDILIFDDSLSAVDTETDSQIRAGLKERRKDVTTIIISGRINTLMEADRIFVMEKGKVSDMGTHHELSQREGLYKKIWEIQRLEID